LEEEPTSFYSQNLWQKVLRKKSSAHYSYELYEEAYESLVTKELSELSSIESLVPAGIRFEHMVAYLDVLIEKAAKGSNLTLNSNLFSQSRQWSKREEKLLVHIKNKFRGDKTLTRSEISSLIKSYSQIRLGKPSLKGGLALSFERMALNSFLTKVSTLSLQDLFLRKGFKDPNRLQRIIDQMVIMSQSRVALWSRNVILPIVQAKSGLFPLPVKPVDFILDDETVGMILRDGFASSWPAIKKKYQRLGYTQLSFNAFARAYRPVGAVGFFITAYLLMQERNQQALADRASEVEQLLNAELEKSQEIALEIVEKLEQPLVEEAILEFKELHGRAPNEEEKEEILLLFGE
jgi:hypothetical protein